MALCMFGAHRKMGGEGVSMGGEGDWFRISIGGS